MPFEQGGVQGPAQQMIFDGGGLHFGRGRSTTARVEENGKIKGKLRAGTSQIGVDLTVSPSCWIITVWQMVLERKFKVFMRRRRRKFYDWRHFCLVFLANDGGGLALRQESNEQGGLWQLRSR